MRGDTKCSRADSPRVIAKMRNTAARTARLAAIGVKAQTKVKKGRADRSAVTVAPVVICRRARFIVVHGKFRPNRADKCRIGRVPCRLLQNSLHRLARKVSRALKGLYRIRPKTARKASTRRSRACRFSITRPNGGSKCRIGRVPCRLLQNGLHRLARKVSRALKGLYRIRPKTARKASTRRSRACRFPTARPNRADKCRIGRVLCHLLRGYMVCPKFTLYSSKGNTRRSRACRFSITRPNGGSKCRIGAGVFTRLF